MTDTLAQRIASRPDAYGARYRNLSDAIQCAYRQVGGRAKYRIIHGDDGTFWVMRGTYAASLIKAGYEQAAR